MEYNIETAKKVLNDLKEDPMRVIYTEHYLKQIEKRNIPDICIEELIENGKLLKINHIEKSEFELVFNMDDSKKLHVIIILFNSDSIILISSAYENTGFEPSASCKVELEEVYDFAFDLMDLNSKYGYRYDQSIELEHGFNIDFDFCGHPVGIEMHQASKKFRLHRNQLLSAVIDGQIEITPNLIKVRLKATPASADINVRVLEKEITNDYGIRENVFDLMVENIS